MKCCVSTDVGTWTNWLTFEADRHPDYSPDAGTGLVSAISLKRCYAEFYVGKIRRIGPTYWPLAARRGFNMILFSEPSKHLCRRYMRYTECPSSYSSGDGPDEWSYRSDFGDHLQRVLNAVSIRTQVNVDCFDRNFKHPKDVLGHLTVRTVCLCEDDHTVFADYSADETLRRLRPTERRQCHSHSIFHSIKRVNDLELCWSCITLHFSLASNCESCHGNCILPVSMTP